MDLPAVFQSLLKSWTFCACLLAIMPVANGEESVSVKGIGLDGYFALGRTTLLTAEVNLDETREVVVRVSAADSQGNLAEFTSEPVRVSAGEPTDVGVRFQLGQLGAPLDVTVLDGDKVIASTRQQLGDDSGLLSPKTDVIGLIGRPQGLPQWFNARRIMIRFKPEDSRLRRREDEDINRSEAEAKQLADDLISQLKSGDATFESLMGEYSEGRSLGVFTPSDETEEVVPFLRTVRVGEFGGPFKTARGQSKGKQSNAFQILDRSRLPQKVVVEQLEDRIFIDMSADMIPSDPSALSLVQTIVIAGDYEMDDDRVRSLMNWVRFGGHLIVSAGRNVEAFRESALGKAVQQRIPLEPEVSRMAELPGLVSFTDHRTAIRISTGSPMIAARIGETDGITLVSGSDGPLIEQVVHGFGRLTFIGLDIDEGPLAEWSGLPSLMNRVLFERKRLKRSNTAIQSESIGHTGVTDIATQLNASSSHFPSVKRPSSWVAMLLILGYMLVVGPLDYLIVHRLLKRPRLTWITFPTFVVAGCAVGVWLAGSANGNETKLNETSIVDIDASSAEACRVRSWYSVYSPSFRRAEIKVAPSSNLKKLLNGGTVEPSLLTWNGVPENVFGGMLRAGGASLGSVSYKSGDASVSGLPIPIWSTASLQSEWRGTCKPTIKSDLKTNSAGKLRGSVTHQLPFTIKNWIVAHGLTGYYPRDADDRVPEIRAGQSWSPQSPTVKSRDLESYLTGVRIIHIQREAGEGGEDTAQSKKEYDALELDPDYAVRFLSLHEAAGGTVYTGLTNHLLSELDLSRTIDLNRAILIGEIETPTGTVTLDDSELEPTRSRTFVRIMLPVERPERSRR